MFCGDGLGEQFVAGGLLDCRLEAFSQPARELVAEGVEAGLGRKDIAADLAKATAEADDDELNTEVCCTARHPLSVSSVVTWQGWVMLFGGLRLGSLTHLAG